MSFIVTLSVIRNRRLRTSLYISALILRLISSRDRGRQRKIKDSKGGIERLIEALGYSAYIYKPLIYYYYPIGPEGKRRQKEMY